MPQPARSSMLSGAASTLYSPTAVQTRVAQNARGVVEGVVKGVTRASFGRRAPLSPQLKGRQQGVAKRKLSGGSTWISGWRLCTLVRDRHTAGRYFIARI